jgi:prepilin-type processing-associated H-X9-DG protein
MYVDDSDECYPKGTPCEYGYYWSNLLYCQITGKELEHSDGGLCTCGQHPKYNNYLGYNSSGNRYEYGTVFHCPSQVISPMSNNPTHPVSYTLSRYLGGFWRLGVAAKLALPYIKASTIKTPSRMMMVMEAGCLSADVYDWRDSVLPEMYVEANDGIHQNGVNVLFVDGHVERKGKVEIPTSRTSTDGAPFWEGHAK